MKRPIVTHLAALCLAALLAAEGRAAAPSSELDGKIVVGYQGWFGCAGDAGDGGFMHWQRPDGGLGVEMLPDVSELPARDVCTFTPKDAGAAVTVYSAANPAIVDLHFRWMQHYDISVAAVQRFVSVLTSPLRLEFSDRELSEIRQAATRYRRTFFVEYDLSGSSPADMPLILANIRALAAGGLTGSPAYQTLRARPLIGLWGLGFAGRSWTPDAAASLIAQVKDVIGGASVMVGVPAAWRTGRGDASNDPAWLAVWPKADLLTPWTVGRFTDDALAARFRRDVTGPDVLWARQAGLIYLPTAFPGFSWSNMHNGQTPRNQIPRRCGAFLQGQLAGMSGLGLDKIFVAMFDEVDEGTAIYKTRRNWPDGVALDADGCTLPPDAYLRIVQEAAQHLRSP